MEGTSHPNVVTRVRVRIGFCFILYAWNYNSSKLLKLLEIVVNNLIGLQREDWLEGTIRNSFCLPFYAKQGGGHNFLAEGHTGGRGHNQ